MTLALEAYKALDKYILHNLKELVLKFILKKVAPENVFLVLRFNELYELPALKAKCWTVIQVRTEQCLRLDIKNFVMSSWGTLCDLLENGRLTIREYTLFETILA